jgi:hypothetical protein
VILIFLVDPELFAHTEKRRMSIYHYSGISQIHSQRVNRPPKQDSGELAESKDARFSDATDAKKLSSEWTMIDLTVPVGASMRKQLAFRHGSGANVDRSRYKTSLFEFIRLMERHRTHQLNQYTVQADPGAYVADSTGGAILQFF